MLVRCTHCYTPFTLSQEGVIAALDEVEAKGFKYYNAFCPRCGRPNMVPRAQLEREAPGWTPRSIAMQPVTSPPAEPKAETPALQANGAPKPASAAAPKPATKKPAAAKPATKKAAPKKKAATKKPAAKKASAAKKQPAKKATKAKATKAKSIANKKKTAKKKKR